MKLRTWCIRIGHILTKTGSALKMALLLMLVCCFNSVFAELDTQGITIRQQNASLEKVFQSIEKQTGYRFFYNESLLEGAGKVSLNLQNVSLQEALEACFRDQPFTYSIVERTIIVKRKGAVVSRTAATAPLGKIIAVRGKVTSVDKPVVGATVTVKGTENATSTDNEGIFTLPEVDDQSTLVVTHVNHQAKEVKLKGEGFIAVDLEGKVNELEESIVVAYNTTTQKRNTGSVTVVKGDQIATLPNRSIDKSLQGMVPGLQITNGTGQPGGGVSNFVLRGISTGTDAFFGSTVRNPLIVVDGIPVSQDHFQFTTSTTASAINNPLAQLNPSDVEAITVLKDAAAIALYGSKASNGVILITTKKGKLGKTVFAIRHQTDISSRLKGKTQLLNQEEYLELLYETYKNTPRSPTPWTDALIKTDLIKNFPTIVNAPGDTTFYDSPNWHDNIFNSNAITTNNEISMSGGNDKSNFYLNLGYTKQNGIVRKTGYDQKSLRFNFENRPISGLKLGLISMLSYNIQDYTNPVENASDYALATLMSPLNPVRSIDGSYILNYSYGSTQSASSPIANPVAAAEYNINQSTAYRGLSKLYAELRFLKNFTFTSNLGVDFMLAELKEKIDPRLRASGLTAGNGSIKERDRRRANLITTNILQYDRNFNQHGLNVLVAQEAQVITEKTLHAEARGAALPYYNDISSPGYSMYSLAGSRSRQTLLSYFGQTNYNYKGKYFLSASLRRDGSSRFGNRQQWGSFWSTGIGWVVTEESFMNRMTNWMSFLKFRGSIGVAGSSAAVDATTRFDQLGQRIFLNELALVPQAQPGNPDIQWEETFTWDAGMEARLLKDKITVTLDVYNRSTSNLIYTTNLASVTGYPTVLDNIGDMVNKGVELSISADVIRFNNFRWRIIANWSTNQNKLIKANVPLASVTGELLGNEEGRNFNSFYLKKWAGVNPDDGKPLWIDSAGKPTSNYNSAKREFVGKPQPDGFGAITNAFTYKNIDLSVLFYYQYGSKIYNADLLLNDGLYPYINQSKGALNRWQKAGDIALNPRRILNNSNRGTDPSTRYLFNGDYIRLQNVTLSYIFPKHILDRLHLNMLKVYAQGHNLAIWTNFPGQDPDNANVGGSIARPYPNQRSYSLGLNLNF